MRFIGLWLMLIETEEPGREISEGFGLLASMLPQGFMVSLIAV